MFATTWFPTGEQKRTLANEIDMTFQRVQIWFQNKRQLVKKAKSNQLTAFTHGVLDSSIMRHEDGNDFLQTSRQNQINNPEFTQWKQDSVYAYIPPEQLPSTVAISPKRTECVLSPAHISQYVIPDITHYLIGCACLIFMSSK